MKKKTISTLVWIVPVALILYLLVDPKVIYITEVNLFIPPLVLIGGLLAVTVFQLAHLPLRKIFGGNVLLEIGYALFPTMVFLLFVFAQYELFWALILLLLAISASVLLCRKVLKGEKLPLRKKKEIVMRVSLMAACAVLLIPSALSLWKYEMDSPYYTASATYQDLLYELFDSTEERLTKQALVEQNACELQKLSKDTWQSLSIQERLDILKLIADIETYDLQIPSVPVVKSEKFDSFYTLAEYDHGSRTITIDLQYLNVDSSYQAIESVLHEVRHVWQHYVCDNLDFDDEATKCSFYDQPREWQAEFLDYQSYGEPYYDQAVEVDAREYSGKQTALYFMWLDLPAE